MHTENNYLVICVDHHLTPEHPYPVIVKDVMDILKWIYHKGKAELGADPKRIAIDGASLWVYIPFTTHIKAN